MTLKKKPPSKGERKRLGMNTPITRRDFLNATLIGAGASLLTLPAPMRLFAAQPSWDGPGGVGDYAAAHGNSEAVRLAGHRLRDGTYDQTKKARPAEERYDLIIVGGGLTGLGAAHRFQEIAAAGQRCLLLENHLLMGGEAKRNEFEVNGHRLFGPQGSNSFVVPQSPGESGYAIYRALGIPTEFTYEKLDARLDDLWFDTTNFGHLLWLDAPHGGAFFAGAEGSTSPRWIKNFWRDGYRSAPLPSQVKEDLRLLMRAVPSGGADFERRLDTMTFKAYLEKVLGHPSPAVALLDPILASVMGLGCDAISAYGARQVVMPGLARAGLPFPAGDRPWHSFPGGNDGICRFLVKALIPEAIGGAATFPDIHNRPLRPEAFDQPDRAFRLRLGSTVVRVEHTGEQGGKGAVRVTYERGGEVHAVEAGAVLMASGSWVARRAVVGLPDPYQEAFASFHRSPMLVVNVALTNWQFLYRLKLTGCRWFDGFGFSCNIRRPMRVGPPSPFDPALPIVLTMYVPFYYPGLAVREQGARGRQELLATSFAEYEIMIRRQLQRLFGAAGFDPRRDIAGIVLNRWGHAYVNPAPGFYFGGSGERAARDLLREPFARVAFAHSEFNGHQHWAGAVEEGRRGVESLARFL